MQERENFKFGKYGIDYSIYNIYKHEKLIYKWIQTKNNFKASELVAGVF